MEWLGRAKTEFVGSKKLLHLSEKDGSQTNLRAIVEQTTPPCHLNPFLFNGHIQTMWTATKQHGPPVYYKRRVFQAEQPVYSGSFAVDFAVKPYKEEDPNLPPRTTHYTEEEFSNLSSDDNEPQLVVLHGLSGGSHEIYLRHVIAPLMADSPWHVCVVNSRGCAMSEVTGAVLYNARATWDVRQTVKWLKERFPNRPLFGLGFSLGANILTNYVGEEGAGCLLKAAVACSNPFNLEVSSKALQRSLLGKEVYQRVMGASMKKLIEDHKDSVEKHTNLDWESVKGVKYLYEFDRVVQCALWGYPTEDAYYRDASSSDSILAIRIPFLALSAKDDPIAVDEAVPYGEFQNNPYTILCSTSLGGHLCWFELGGGRWHARPVCNFLNYMAFKVDLESIKRDVVAETSQQGPHFDPMRRKFVIPQSQDLH